MKEYIESRIKNYEITFDKIQEAIEECGKNDLWDIIKNLEKGIIELQKLIEEDRKLLLEYE